MYTPDDSPLTEADRELIERFRHDYAPPPRAPGHRLALHDALQARLQRRWIPTWTPIAAAACAAALALWFVLPERWTNPPPTTSAAGDVLAAYALESDVAGELDDLLPQDYARIEDIFEL